MYAIVDINGIQTRVSPDLVLEVPQLTGEPGAKLTFDKVLLVCNGDKISVGAPHVKSANRVSSLPMPTLRPGCTLVPR